MQQMVLNSQCQPNTRWWQKASLFTPPMYKCAKNTNIQLYSAIKAPWHFLPDHESLYSGQPNASVSKPKLQSLERICKSFTFWVCRFSREHACDAMSYREGFINLTLVLRINHTHSKNVLLKVGPRPAASASPGDLLAIQVPRAHPRPPEAEI